MRQSFTAAEIVGSPWLYNLSWRIGKDRVVWECMGVSRDDRSVKFARLVPVEHMRLRQITIYVKPEQIMTTTDDTSAWHEQNNESEHEHAPGV